MITITVDTKEATRWLNDVQRKQIPFATSVALNNTAKIAQGEIKIGMKSVLDRPKPYTLGGTFVAASTKNSLKAVVGLKDKASSGRAAGTYLVPLVAGIPRRQTGWERALQKFGAIPPGMRAVPGAAAKIDSYGNISRAQLTEMMGALKSRARLYKGRGKGVYASGYFVAFPGRRETAHLVPGIYRRVERKGESIVQPVAIFVDQARYRPTLDIARTVERTVSRDFRREFDAALARALETAR